MSPNSGFQKEAEGWGDWLYNNVKGVGDWTNRQYQAATDNWVGRNVVNPGLEMGGAVIDNTIGRGIRTGTGLVNAAGGAIGGTAAHGMGMAARAINGADSPTAAAFTAAGNNMYGTAGAGLSDVARLGSTAANSAQNVNFNQNQQMMRQTGAAGMANATSLASGAADLAAGGALTAGTGNAIAAGTRAAATPGAGNMATRFAQGAGQSVAKDLPSVAGLGKKVLPTPGAPTGVAGSPAATAAAAEPVPTAFEGPPRPLPPELTNAQWYEKVRPHLDGVNFDMDGPGGVRSPITPKPAAPTAAQPGPVQPGAAPGSPGTPPPVTPAAGPGAATPPPVTPVTPPIGAATGGAADAAAAGAAGVADAGAAGAVAGRGKLLGNVGKGLGAVAAAGLVADQVQNLPNTVQGLGSLPRAVRAKFDSSLYPEDPNIASSLNRTVARTQYDDASTALTSLASQLKPGEPVTPEVQTQIQTSVRDMIPYLVSTTGKSPDELWQKYSADGFDQRDIQEILKRPDVQTQVAAAAQAGVPDPEVTIVDQFMGLPTPQKVALGLGIPIALIGLLSSVMGEGGAGSLLMAALGLGASAYGAGMFGGQSMFGGGSAGAPPATQPGAAPNSQGAGAMPQIQLAMAALNGDEKALSELAGSMMPGGATLAGMFPEQAKSLLKNKARQMLAQYGITPQHLSGAGQALGG